MKKVAVVILNFNTVDYLKKFIPVLKRNTGEEAEIVVADNCSTDGSQEYIRDAHPDVALIKIPENLGFCAGYNFALRQINSEYFVLLNSDIEVGENWLPPLLETAESDEKVGCVQPKLLSFTERDNFEYAGGAGGFMDILGYPFNRGRIFEDLEKDEGQYDDKKEIFWATGACLLIKSELYFNYGGLDNKFFAHMEEIDLCWRLKNAGYKHYYVPESRVFHVGGGTLHKSNPRKTYFNFRNGLMMLFKNLPTIWLIPIILLRLILDGIAGLKFLMAGEIGNFKAVLRGHFHFYTRIPILIQSRRKNRKLGKFSIAHKEILKRSLIWEYFVRKKKTFSALEF
ncbi:glycosyltransferase family 2 protein [Flexithrix dorotheae]|uniref:glycosyltransferase family 2 protein n=1 Tax=Flexithrix dorotheae TaxID=70993 RepID=UPI00035EF51E|nr:glycosyltransferase family 2 protein [Flexithrix dorotheae]